MKRKFYLIGTRGIPNKYGGFEEFAEKVYEYNNQHEVVDLTITSCEPSTSSFKNIKYFKITPIYGEFIKQIIYDTKTAWWLLFQPKGTVYLCGYGTAFLGIFLLKIFKKLKNHNLVLNCDGLEWKRTKFKSFQRPIIKRLEYLSCHMVDKVIADNLGIQNYLKEEYNLKSEYIPYGANLIDLPKSHSVDLSKSLKLEKESYDLVIARIEPENNIEEIINAYEIAGFPLVIVGNFSTSEFGIKLKARTKQNVIWLGGIYDIKTEMLRKNCRNYVHGHSVGGTNPSLLQAMASDCNLLMHDNIFNREVANGTFWNDTSELVQIIQSNPKNDKSSNRIKLKKEFQWNKICKSTLNL